MGILYIYLHLHLTRQAHRSLLLGRHQTRAVALPPTAFLSGMVQQTQTYGTERVFLPDK